MSGVSGVSGVCVVCGVCARAFDFAPRGFAPAPGRAADAFVYCSPTRVSLMTGRLPYHAQQSNYPNCDLGQGAPPNMTFISTKLKTAGE